MASAYRSTSRADLLALLASTDVFQHLDVELLREFEHLLKRIFLPGGDTLTRRGDPGDSVYILVNGRLRVFVQDEEGREKAVGEVARGQVVGEMALLTDAPRSATVRAIRDSELVRISREVASEFVRKHPEAMTQVTRQIVARLERSQSRPRVDESPASFALIPADPGVPLEAFATRFARALREFGTTEVLDSTGVDNLLGSGVSQTWERSTDSERMLAWLQERESEWRYLVYRGDARFSNWTMRCLRQADRILIVASAGADPSPGALEAEIERRFGEATSAERHLILLHSDDRSHPSGTEAWLAPRRLDHHHHVRLRSEEDYARLARIVGGRSVGVVLGGGGARGLSHVGALRAIRDLNIPIDLIGGTSMGAIIGAVHAMGHAPEALHEIAERFFVRQGRLFDFTLPVVSLTAGRRIRKRLEEFFGETRIEDFWINFFCVSSNLTRAEVMIHRRGLACRQIRASISLPGVLPPVVQDGDLLIDGGVMNNLPVDVMRRSCKGGTVLALDVSPKVDLAMKSSYGDELSGWRVLARRLNPFGESMEVPGIASVLMRTTVLASSSMQNRIAREADFRICPPLEEFGLLDFKSFARIEDIGYRHAREQLEKWLASMAGAPRW